MKGVRKAWIGLGGNIGDVASAMREAVHALGESGEIRLTGVSRLYSTPPWGLADQPDFLNAAVEVETSLDPARLLEACLHAERRQKRERRVRWGPRNIDLDILAMEGVEMSDEQLTIPHPRLAQRAFALLPLADLAPDLIIAGRTVRDMAASADGSDITVVEDSGWLESRPA